MTSLDLETPLSARLLVVPSMGLPLSQRTVLFLAAQADRQRSNPCQCLALPTAGGRAQDSLYSVKCFGAVGMFDRDGHDNFFSLAMLHLWVTGKLVSAAGEQGGVFFVHLVLQGPSRSLHPSCNPIHHLAVCLGKGR